MTEVSWVSIGLGAGVGLLYSLASILMHRWALRLSDRQFLSVFVGGLIARMAMALLLVVLVLRFVAVQELLFIGTFLLVFLAGLSAEVVRMHQQQGARQRKTD